MKSYRLSEIAKICHGVLSGNHPNEKVDEICTDTRRLVHAENSIFIALKGKNQDENLYIRDAYQEGVRCFLIQKELKYSDYENAGFILVENTLKALQKWAGYHRNLFQIPIIGITGSNGKTIIKEWLYQLLEKDEKICKSPKSYNSQIGVPLSVLQLEDYHTLGIFEAGISTVDEMEKLEKVIHPNIGIFTNLGPAHDAGFSSRKEKVVEKLKLFEHCDKVIYCSDYQEIKDNIKSDAQSVSWGRKKTDKYQIISKVHVDKHALIKLKRSSDEVHRLKIPFANEAYIEDAVHCFVLLSELGYDADEINRRVANLSMLPMRLELKYGIHECTIIDDSYSADLRSLEIALEFYRRQNSKQKRTLIISEFEESGLNNVRLIQELKRAIQPYQFQKVIGVGALFVSAKSEFENFVSEFYSYPTTEDLIEDIAGLHFDREDILIKGARKFRFEKVTFHLLGQIHRTVFEIDLNALSDNFDVYKSLLKNGASIIPMVKAFSYGSGSTEIAHLLEDKGVKYMAVAYTDEGVILRDGEIKTGIIVMNPSVQDFEKMIENHLEPNIYELDMLKALIYFLQSQNLNQTYPIHIKIETGMNRLGFIESELDELLSVLKNQEQVRVETLFSHLAASDEPQYDAFTLEQFQRFNAICQQFEKTFDYPIRRHILNSSGIVRFADCQYDYVRLGIGLYGIDSSRFIQEKLAVVGTLKTSVSQVKEVMPGETVGYGRKGKISRPSKIAVIAIGYADGYDRRFSNGVGEVFVNGQNVKIIGNVCMDMCMADVTDIKDVKIGDEVEVYGRHISIIDCADKIGTIPYELLTKISRRVRRVYFWG
ncbi:MAG: bifunctional UDP-N-acetylmuramoyl-tripeptide:D-alanyl-D-alanine ligase/alanine racemase [Chitinophagales bacterium]|nr:bifunctional UDP-N-acetylmuramoyl-tripeptide:D-alanyl-D-alanine ligase/alanine racemase [Chitinophagales bacterium]